MGSGDRRWQERLGAGRGDLAGGFVFAFAADLHGGGFTLGGTGMWGEGISHGFILLWFVFSERTSLFGSNDCF